MGSGKRISQQGAPLGAAVHCCGPAGHAPLYYASHWEHHRKVSVRVRVRLCHLQPEGTKTLSFCFSTFTDTAQSRGHMPTVQDLRCSFIHSAECERVLALTLKSLDMNGLVIIRLVFSVELLCFVMPYWKSHPSASVGSYRISFQRMTKWHCRAKTHKLSNL